MKLNDPYELMQRAVDIVNSSEHPQNKIAAVLAGHDPEGAPYTIAYTNYWPEAIRVKIGTQTRIGNASGTVHAETACIMNSPKAGGAELFITDPFCPNCAKNLAEAGIKTIYIDHKGFEKDFVNRRGEHFETMSLKICEEAGIRVCKIWRRERRIECLLEADSAGKNLSVPVSVHYVYDSFKNFITAMMKEMNGVPFAASVGTDIANKTNIALVAQAGLVTGMRNEDNQEEGKYNFAVEPINRLLMNAAKNGIRLNHEHIFSSRIPTAREQVNLAGIGVTGILVGSKSQARGEDSLEAMRLMEEKGVMSFVECL